MNKQMTKRLTEDMEEIQIKLGERSDIWQDRYIWNMAGAIKDTLQWIKRREERMYKDTTTTGSHSITSGYMSMAQHGWQCPLCGTVYAPWVMCCECGKSKPYVTTTASSGQTYIPYKHPNKGNEKGE